MILAKDDENLQTTTMETLDYGWSRYLVEFHSVLHVHGWQLRQPPHETAIA